jgi:nicotinamide-nucleotide amidase
MLGERITSVPGSSDVFLGGIIAYHNEIKREALGVRQADLEAFGAVSEPVALQMAAGVRERMGADIGISITGIAGPGGGSTEKPVGLVWIGVHGSEGTARRLHAGGDRGEIRQRAVQAALEMLRRTLQTG